MYYITAVNKQPYGTHRLGTVAVLSVKPYALSLSATKWLTSMNSVLGLPARASITIYNSCICRLQELKGLVQFVSLYLLLK